jgi:hypothetical protein
MTSPIATQSEWSFDLTAYRNESVVDVKSQDDAEITITQFILGANSDIASGEVVLKMSVTDLKKLNRAMGFVLCAG